MPSTPKVSMTIEGSMRSHAANLTRPEQRLATIDRFVEACDAIEDGTGSDLIAKYRGEAAPPRHGYEITPTNIENYVRAKGWSGPVRVTIERDKVHFRPYVEAREAERQNKRPRRRPSARTENVENAINSVPLIENRVLLREELARGSQALRDLQLLKQGLNKIAPVAIEALLCGQAGETLSTIDEHLSEESRRLLRDLILRLQDARKMGQFGLVLVNDRLQQLGGLEDTLVAIAEMRLLKRLARLPEIDSAAFEIDL